MSTNTKIGNFLYTNADLPFYSQVLSILNENPKGASFITVAGKPQIMSQFNNDVARSQQKVKSILSSLRMRSVIFETQQPGSSFSVYKIADKDVALTLISEGGKIVERLVQRTADCANTEKVSAVVSNINTNTKKVNTMATKTATKKAPRLFVNPETSKVEPFGAGRPSKAKLAFESNADGQYLNPQAALAFAQQGGKSEDKLTKAELLDLLRKVRAERDEAIAARDTLAGVLGSLNTASVDAEADSDDGDDLDLDAESVDADDEIEATDAE
jgi:hypothetical protein